MNAPSRALRVYIALSDAVYAEMLRLELYSDGITAFLWRGTRPCPAQGDDIVICDDNSAEYQTGRTVIISRGSAGTEDFDADGCCFHAGRLSFHRPFLISRFRRELCALAMPEPRRISADGTAETAAPAQEKPERILPLDNLPDESKTAKILTRTLDGGFCFGSDRLTLTSCENLLLAELYEHRGTAVPRALLCSAVWGRGTNTNLVDVYIRYLREKLDLRYDVRLIMTVRGVGYMLKI